MKIIKNIIKIIGTLIGLLILIGTVYLYQSGPILPKETDAIIANIHQSPLPETITGQTGVAQNGGVNIWYENRMPVNRPKGTILLIMGISNDALGWPPAFLSALVDSGYQVIRYDHRGTGLSDWEVNQPYNLTDMAKDGMAILDTLQIQKAHILGVSMGGMIAQEMAIKFPNRVQTLTSIMSSGNVFDNTLPPISSAVAIELIKVAAKYGILGSENNMIKLHLASRIILMGSAKQMLNISAIAIPVLYNIRHRKGYNAHVSSQHQVAVQASGSRYVALEQLMIPTLIIHGKADPFIPLEHGQKMARLMPTVDSLWVNNMGHDIPDVLVPSIIGKIVGHYRAYD